MFEGQNLGPPQRQIPDGHPPQLHKEQPVAKRRRLSGQSTRPSTYWDGLSRIWLTKGALQELDRRISNAARYHSLPTHQDRPRQPSTCSVATSWRQDHQPATDFLRQCSADSLQSIRQFARHGGPDLRDLSGYHKCVKDISFMMSSRGTSSRSRTRGSSRTPLATKTTATEDSGTSGAYSANFQQKLIDSGVYPDEYEYLDGSPAPIPNNMGAINERLRKHRPSLSPSRFPDVRFKEFKKANASATKESKAAKRVVPIIEGTLGDGQCDGGGIRFTNLASLTEEKLVPATPDIYHGSRPEQLNRQIRMDLGPYITPAKNDSYPAIPNFFLEVKGPDGSTRVAKLQAMYDGALGTRAMHSLRSYGGDDSVFDNNAYTISATYHDGQLQLYAHHSGQSTESGSRIEYYMNQVNGYCLTGNANSLREGIGAYRNAREWAKEQRDAAIDRANRKIEQQVNSSSSNKNNQPSTETFAVSQKHETLLAGMSHNDNSKEVDFSPDLPATEFAIPLKRGRSKTSRRLAKRRNIGDFEE